MSLRARLVLVLGSLVAVLLAAEWGLVRALTRELDAEVDTVALSVGSSIFSLIAPHELASEAWVFGASSSAEPRPARQQDHWVSQRPGSQPEILHVSTLGGTIEFERDLEIFVVAAEGTLDAGAQPFPGTARRPSAEPLPVLRSAQVEWRGLGYEDLAAPRSSRVALRVGSRWATGPELDDVTTLDSAAPVRIPVPRQGLAQALDTFRSKLLLGSIALFLVGLGTIAWVAHRVTRPLRALARGAQRVGQGELGVRVPEGGDREVATALAAFNEMSVRLAALDAEAARLRDREHLGELGEVARGLAHALRNPLHTLGLAVDALAAGTLGSEQPATARAARTQIERIDSALAGLLTLASAGGQRERVALEDLAHDVALELAQSPHPCAVEVQSECGRTEVYGVPAELRAVLHALVVNAAEAAPEATVTVRLGAGDGRARVEVLDSGPGLAPEVRARLFTPHVTTKPQGTGMGLYLAERIARTRYGGSLALHPRAEGGLRAELVLAVDAERGPLT